MNTQEMMLSPAEVAALLGVTQETLRRWRRQQFGPEARRMGPRLVRYSRADVQHWIDTRGSA